jgi:hypothetical protein
VYSLLCVLAVCVLAVCVLAACARCVCTCCVDTTRCVYSLWTLLAVCTRRVYLCVHCVRCSIYSLFSLCMFAVYRRCRLRLCTQVCLLAGCSRGVLLPLFSVPNGLCNAPPSLHSSLTLLAHCPLIAFAALHCTHLWILSVNRLPLVHCLHVLFVGPSRIFRDTLLLPIHCLCTACLLPTRCLFAACSLASSLF